MIRVESFKKEIFTKGSARPPAAKSKSLGWNPVVVENQRLQVILQHLHVHVYTHTQSDVKNKNWWSRDQELQIQ